MEAGKEAYLTTRDLKRLSTKAFQEAAEEAMKVVGHVVKVDGAWLVREDADGTTTRLRRIPKDVSVADIVLD